MAMISRRGAGAGMNGLNPYKATHTGPTSGRNVGKAMNSFNGYTAARPAVLGAGKLLLLGAAQVLGAAAAPAKRFLHIAEKHEEGKDPDDPSMWLFLGIAMILVLSGGAFAGLTIA
jgi:metal transporter CNNM